MNLEPWKVAAWWELHRHDPAIQASLERQAARAEKVSYRAERFLGTLLGFALGCGVIGWLLSRDWEKR